MKGRFGVWVVYLYTMVSVLNSVRIVVWSPGSLPSYNSFCAKICSFGVYVEYLYSIVFGYKGEILSLGSLSVYDSLCAQQWKDCEA